MPEDTAQSTAPVVEALHEKYPLLGIALKHHKSTRGTPLTFKDKPYLIELYCDAPKVGFDAMKAVQVGWSELLIQLVLERAGEAGRIAAYVLPTYQLRDRFVQRRVHPPLEQVPYYQGKLPNGGDLGSLRIKKFGEGGMLFLGSNTVNDFIEFSADVLIVDEFDRCVQENLALARDRLRASPYPQLYRVGNPTRPHYGVAGLYDVSDGRKWHHQCGHCGERQHLEWTQHIVDRDASGRWVLRDKKMAAGGWIRPICRKCGKPFDRVAKGGGWVAERPDNVRRGYCVSRLDVLSQDIRPLWHEWLEAQGSAVQLAAFSTSVMGRPYESEGAAVTAQVLANAAIGAPIDIAGDKSLQDEFVVAGIDVGSKALHVNIAILKRNDDTDKRTRVGRFVGTVATFDDLYDMLLRFHVNAAVVDSRPEMRMAQALRDKCLETGVCDLWLCQFHPTERVGRESYGRRLDYARRVVTVDRTQLLDATLDEMRMNPPQKVFPEDVWHVPGWGDEMVASRRVLNDRGDKFIWDEGNADDHYRFADAYERVAADMLNTSGSYISEEWDQYTGGTYDAQ